MNAPARATAASTTATTRTSRTSSRTAGRTFPLPEHPAPRSSTSRSGCARCRPQNSLFALRAALYETDKLIREGIPEEGFEATKTFLANYSNLWAQDVSRRLGYAIDGVVTGKDLVKELQARLPKMTKADVDAAVRKHLALDGADDRDRRRQGRRQVADTLLAGAPDAASSTTPPARRPRSSPRTTSSSGSRCRSRRTTCGSCRSTDVREVALRGERFEAPQYRPAGWHPGNPAAA